VIEELEQESGEACPDSVIGADIPDAFDVVESRAYRREAQVALDGDVVFLAVSGGGWLITGAGCTPRPDRPYDSSARVADDADRVSQLPARGRARPRVLDRPRAAAPMSNARAPQCARTG